MLTSQNVAEVMAFKRTKHHYSANVDDPKLNREAPDLEMLWGPVACAC